jgi:hypothetical protein
MKKEIKMKIVSRTGLKMIVAMFMLLVTVAPINAASFKIGEADWSLGGSARLDAGWRLMDFGNVPSGQVKKNQDFFLSVPWDTNIFAKVAYANTGSYLQLGLKPQTLDAPDSTITIQQFYATYDFGSGNSLLAGQVNTCLAEDSPNQRLNQDATLAGFGDLFVLPHPQIRFIHSAGADTFQIAIEKSKTKSASDLGLIEDSVDDTNYVVNDIAPALVLSYSHDGGKFVLTPTLYAQRFTLKGNATGVKDVDVTSYSMAVDAGLKLEACTLSGELWYGQNVTLITDITNAHNASFGMPVADGSGYIKNVESMGGWLQLAVPLKTGKISTGAGYQKADVKNLPVADYESSVSTWGAFINYEFPLSKNFTIIPEVAYYDYGHAPEKTKTDLSITGTNDNGGDVFLGVHFQYDF